MSATSPPFSDRVPAACGAQRDHEPTVAFYESQEHRARTVEEFVSAGLRGSAAVVVVATAEHATTLTDGLRAAGTDVDGAGEAGRLTLVDAVDVLEDVMVDGTPDPVRFRTLLDPIVERAGRGGRPVRIYDGTVALLRGGHDAAALALTHLWGGLAVTRPFALLRALPLSAFSGSTGADAFLRMCGGHTAVIPAESFPSFGTPNVMRVAVAMLQQQNSALRARIARLGWGGTGSLGDAETGPASGGSVQDFPTTVAEQWIERIRAALREDRFTMLAQPIVDLASSRIVHHELLLRMVGDDGALIAPGEFLPVAEHFGLVAEIDRWVIREGVRLAAAGHAVQINISGVSLSDPDLGPCVERELVEVGADPSLVTFEFTETAVISNEALAAAFVTTVRALGCRVALDDFGTGYGGFSYLKQFRVDCLKIDREFVTSLTTDPANQHVVRAIVQLAHGLGLTVVAEGVEEGETLCALRELGVDHAQGFYLDRPAPALDVLTVGDVDSRACRDALELVTVS